MTRTASCLVLLATLALIFPPAASAVEYGGIGGRPANPDPNNERTQSIFIHQIEAGSQVQDAIRVVNNTAETKTLTIDAVDSVVSSGGAFACAQKVEAKKDVGAWITLAKNEVTLDSMTNEVVPFTIALPASADAGEHNGCIVIQEKNAAPQQQGSGIQLSFRTGLRVAILVPGQIVRKLEIAGFEVDPGAKNDGSFLLVARVKNDGNVSIDANVAATTEGLFGTQRASYGGKYPVLRGLTSDYSFEMPRPFWGGWYTAKLAVSYDEHPEAVVGKDSGKGLTTLRGTDARFFSPPMPAALAIETSCLVVPLLLIALAVASRKRMEAMRKSWAPYVVAAGDDVNALAKKHGVDWRRIANVNGLKPPYSLKPGETIKLPPVK